MLQFSDRSLRLIKGSESAISDTVKSEDQSGSSLRVSYFAMKKLKTVHVFVILITVKKKERVNREALRERESREKESSTGGDFNRRRRRSVSGIDFA
ncbi:hypothetical protein F2Q69_00045914 [Brassica cretica]|uniref:Uncharacterized protein n=1 Tax=Brassica cretica TaxID=69181 RepID=A0A8S9PSI9_BRACR|nr:hypothetical protein F2Q69_00045914 [Brassica cretica]